MTTIAVVGEIVADAVLPADGIRDGAAHLSVHPGGGPANFAVALARLGTTARFAGRISQGALGQLCQAHLEASGVDLSASVSTPQSATLAIASLDEGGAASYEFYVNGTADWDWTAEQLVPLTRTEPEAPVAIHTGTLALALQPSGNVIETLLAGIREQMTVSIDPNLRTLLVPVGEYRSRIDAWAKLSDIVRLSEDDLLELWPTGSPEEAAEFLHAHGVILVVVSLGRDGAFASLRGQAVRVPIAKTSVVDTVGAGDSFHGGLLHFLGQAGHLGGRLESLTIDGLREALEFASKVAAITVSRAGANPPWANELS